FGALPDSRVEGLSFSRNDRINDFAIHAARQTVQALERDGAAGFIALEIADRGRADAHAPCELVPRHAERLANGFRPTRRRPRTCGGLAMGVQRLVQMVYI